MLAELAARQHLLALERLSRESRQTTDMATTVANQNKAITVFTATTVVFLPLSFASVSRSAHIEARVQILIML
jgi:Mg2+ and Co2+ transporter CorA